MPIVSTFVATAATAGLWTALTTTVVGQLLTSAAFSALATAMAGEPEEAKDPGIKQSIEQGIVPREVIFGRYATRGSLVYHTSTRTDDGDSSENDTYVRATALSDLPVSGLVEVWVDDRRCTIDWNTTDPYGRGHPLIELEKDTERTELRMLGTSVFTEDVSGTKQLGFVRFHDGNQTEADSYLLSVATDERPWSANEVGYGVAYAVTSFFYDRDEFQGFPDVLFVLDGVPLEDPETGQTGTGDDLPAVQVHNLIKGLTYNGEWIYGPQTPGVTDDSDWAAQVAACRAPVPGASGWTDQQKIDAFGSTTVPSRYRSGMAVRFDRKVADVIEDIISACNGRISETGGAYRFQVGDPQAADFSFSDDDILTTRARSFSPFKPLAETVNAVTAVYPSPEDKWADQEPDPLYNPDFEAEDGDRRLPTTVRLDAVPYAEQVQRLMKAALEEARRARRHTITLPPSFWAAQPGDFCTWTSDRNGYEAKLFRVDGVQDEPTGDISFDLTEVDPSDYDFDAEDFTPVAGGTLLPGVLEPYAVPNWQVSGVYTQDGAGRPRRPAILLQWKVAGTGRGILYQIRDKVTGSLVENGSTSDFEAAGMVISGQTILPDTEYEARGKVIRPGLNTPWSPWLSATTPDVRFGPIDFNDDVDELIQELADQRIDTLRPGLRSTGIAVESAEDAVARLQLQIADLSERMGDAGVYVNPETGSVTIFAQTQAERARAEVAQEITTRANADEALAQQITTISATLDENSANISELAQTRVTADGAVAAVEEVLSVEYEGLEALAEATRYAEAGVEGIASGYVWRTRAGGAEGEIELISVSNPDGESSQFSVSADRLYFIGDWTTFFSDVAIDGSLVVSGTITGDAIDTDTLTLSLFADGELQTALYPIEVEYFTSSDPNWSPAYDGLIQVWAIGAGGGGAAGAIFDTDDVQASGGGGGGTCMGFIAKANTSDTYSLVVGAGGASRTANDNGELLTGGAGGASSLSGHGVNFVGNGGGGGSAGRGNTNPSAGAGGTASGGEINWTGGRGGIAQGDAGDWTGCGGGAPRLHRKSVVNGQNKGDDGGSAGATGIPPSLPNAEVTGLLMNGYSDFKGGDGAAFAETGASVTAEDGVFGAGGGGAAKPFWTSGTSATSGKGGDGLVIVVYYGQGNLK